MPRRPKPTAIPLLRIVQQREDADCGVACLAMFTGATYEDALRAVCKVDEEGSEHGLYVPQIIQAASELGMELRKKRPVNLDDDHGILHVRFKDGSRHVVMLIQGGIIADTDGVLWAADDYIRYRQARINAVLVEAA